jgi:hypothetical protein
MWFETGTWKWTLILMTKEVMCVYYTYFLFGHQVQGLYLNFVWPQNLIYSKANYRYPLSKLTYSTGEVKEKVNKEKELDSSAVSALAVRSRKLSNVRKGDQNLLFRAHLSFWRHGICHLLIIVICLFCYILIINHLFVIITSGKYIQMVKVLDTCVVMSLLAYDIYFHNKINS